MGAQVKRSAIGFFCLAAIFLINAAGAKERPFVILPYTTPLTEAQSAELRKIERDPKALAVEVIRLNVPTREAALANYRPGFDIRPLGGALYALVSLPATETLPQAAAVPAPQQAAAALIPPAAAAPGQSRCEIARPCKVNILYGYTKNGRVQIEHKLRAEGLPANAACGRLSRVDCFFQLVAKATTAKLAQTFYVSGVTASTGEGRNERRNIYFIPRFVGENGGLGFDIAAVERHDKPSIWANTDAAKNNAVMVGALDNAAVKAINFIKGNDYNIVVLFTGITDAQGNCINNAIESNQSVLSSACGMSLKDSYFFDMITLHEIGHAFGAYHDEFADRPGWQCVRGKNCVLKDAGMTCEPLENCAFSYLDRQPCISGHGLPLLPKWDSKYQIHSWHTLDRRPACAWIEKAAGPNKPPFCTLMAQWNVDSTCINYRKDRRGWIFEFSHPGLCNTPGYGKRQCGDQNHDNALVIRENMFCVATHHAGAHCPEFCYAKRDAEGRCPKFAPQNSVLYKILPQRFRPRVCGKDVACDRRVPRMAH